MGQSGQVITLTEQFLSMSFLGAHIILGELTVAKSVTGGTEGEKLSVSRAAKSWNKSFPERELGTPSSVPYRWNVCK